MSGARFGGPPRSASWDAQPVHYAIRGSVSGICGRGLAMKRTQRDTHITCLDCLRVRLHMLGVEYADRALDRMALLPSQRFVLLSRALVAAKRLAAWKARRPDGKRPR
jgi:hypothetical protein